MIYDLLIVFSFFMTSPLEMVALTTSRIYVMIYLKILQILPKYVIKMAKTLNFFANWLVRKHMKGRSKLKDVCMSLRIVFSLTNSVDLDEILYYAAFHLGLNCWSKYPFRRSQYNRRECTKYDLSRGGSRISGMGFIYIKVWGFALLI